MAEKMNPKLTPVQEELLERFNSLENKIQGLEKTNNELATEVHHAESGMYDDGLELDKTRGSNIRLEKKLNEIVGDTYSNIEL